MLLNDFNCYKTSYKAHSFEITVKKIDPESFVSYLNITFNDEVIERHEGLIRQQLTERRISSPKSKNEKRKFYYRDSNLKPIENLELEIERINDYSVSEDSLFDDLTSYKKKNNVFVRLALNINSNDTSQIKITDESITSNIKTLNSNATLPNESIQNNLLFNDSSQIQATDEPQTSLDVANQLNPTTRLVCSMIGHSLTCSIPHSEGYIFDRFPFQQQQDIINERNQLRQGKVTKRGTKGVRRRKKSQKIELNYTTKSCKGYRINPDGSCSL
ncbi:unnamed protein product [Brachionus calyciflorus]|uniref:Uncharacterized protein n=1 Tax=Brachionus calyciflorus TaxID=104777 RepID=A0A814RMF3_9BILA|nr:unnamed protein product [Brachionus calyciflorus]